MHTALVRAGLLASLLASMGCTHVRSVRRNPQTGETWTVFSHTFHDDTVSYCAPPEWGGTCRAAREVSRPPSVLPSQAYRGAPPGALPPPPMFFPPGPAPWPPPRR